MSEYSFSSVCKPTSDSGVRIDSVGTKKGSLGQQTPFSALYRSGVFGESGIFLLQVLEGICEKLFCATGDRTRR